MTAWQPWFSFVNTFFSQVLQQNANSSIGPGTNITVSADGSTAVALGNNTSSFQRTPYWVVLPSGTSNNSTDLAVFLNQTQTIYITLLLLNSTDSNLGSGKPTNSTALLAAFNLNGGSKKVPYFILLR
jgi:hypothetical protein